MSINMDKTQQLGAVETAGATVYTLPKVNLLPPEVTAQNTFRRTQFILGGVTAVVVAGLAAGWVGSMMQVTAAEEALAAEQAVTQELKVEEARYAEVPRVLSAIEAVQNAQAQAMATDVAWYVQLDKVNQEFPDGLKFKTLSMTMNDAGAGADAASANPLSTATPIGTLTIEGVGTSYPNVAAWMDALAGHEGFVDPYYNEAKRTAADGKTEFGVTTTVGLTEEILSHRYDREAN